MIRAWLGETERIRMSTLGDVTRRVKRLFGDENSIQLKDSDLIDWTNDAVVTLARETGFSENLLSSAYSSTTDGIPVPDGFFQVKRITFAGNSLLRTSLGELDSLGANSAASGSSATHYYIFADKFYVYPVPATSDTLKVWYAQIPGPLSDPNSTLPVPPAQFNDIVRMVMVRARELDQDYDAMNQTSAEVIQSLARSRDEETGRPNTTFPVVRDDPGDMWY